MKIPDEDLAVVSSRCEESTVSCRVFDGVYASIVTLEFATRGVRIDASELNSIRKREGVGSRRVGVAVVRVEEDRAALLSNGSWVVGWKTGRVEDVWSVGPLTFHMLILGEVAACEDERQKIGAAEADDSQGHDFSIVFRRN
jgi:hypothetical protein